MRRAAAQESERTALLGPLKQNLRHTVRFFPLTEIKTVPTGFPGIAPVGPAIPDIPIPKEVFASFLTECAIMRQTTDETAP
jgi:hypothetical protein